MRRLSSVLSAFRTELRAAYREPGAARKIMPDLYVHAGLAAVCWCLLLAGWPGEPENVVMMVLALFNTAAVLLLWRRIALARRLSPLPWATQDEAVAYYRAQLEGR